MSLIRINELSATTQKTALAAQKIAIEQGSPAYVALGRKLTLHRDFPRVCCHRVYPDGMVACCVMEA